MKGGPFKKGYDPRRNVNQILRKGHKWQWRTGQSGNLAGYPRNRVLFDAAIAEALARGGTPDQAAKYLWREMNRGGETSRWAFEIFASYMFRPQPEPEPEPEQYDLSRLTDAEIDRLAVLETEREALLAKARVQGDGPVTVNVVYQ